MKVAELQDLIKECKKSLMKLRLSDSSDEKNVGSQIRSLRKEIAQCMTRIVQVKNGK